MFPPPRLKAVISVIRNLLRGCLRKTQVAVGRCSHGSWDNFSNTFYYQKQDLDKKGFLNGLGSERLCSVAMADFFQSLSKELGEWENTPITS
jgi:hypothetical protein